MNDQILKDLGGELSKYAMKFCTCCFFVNAKDDRSERKVNSGTCTLINYKGKQLGITNFHVIDEYRTSKMCSKCRLPSDPGHPRTRKSRA